MPARLIRPIIRLALPAICCVALTACKDAGGEPGQGPFRRASTVETESAGEIVIDSPSTRYTPRQVADGGSIAGTVTADADLRAEAPLNPGTASPVCGPSIADSSAPRQGAGVGNAVVWLEGVRAGKPLPVERRLELESVNCILTPRVQAAVVGSAVNVIGHDDFRQHLRFQAGGETTPRTTVLLGRDEQVIPTELVAKKPGLVIVRDADHPWPRAYLAVFDHPYFAVTKPDGSFTLDAVPAGKYRLVTWHERAKKKVETSVDVSAGAPVKVSVELDAK